MRDIALLYTSMADKDDSAKLYLTKVVGDGNIHLKTDAYRLLTKIELENENVTNARGYYDKLLECIDSLGVNDEIDDKLKGKALFEYVYQTEKAQSLEESNRYKLVMLGVVSFLVIVLAFLLILIWQMSMVRKLKIQNSIKEWKLKGMKNRNIIPRINKQICSDTAIDNAISMQRHISDKEWKEISVATDLSYPEFFKKLKSYVSLTEHELHICMLVKLGVGTSKIAFLTSRAPSTISTTKQRLYRKITKEKGSAEQFEELLSLM